MPWSTVVTIPSFVNFTVAINHIFLLRSVTLRARVLTQSLPMASCSSSPASSSPIVSHTPRRHKVSRHQQLCAVDVSARLPRAGLRSISWPDLQRFLLFSSHHLPFHTLVLCNYNFELAAAQWMTQGGMRVAEPRRYVLEAPPAWSLVNMETNVVLEYRAWTVAIPSEAQMDVTSPQNRSSPCKKASSAASTQRLRPFIPLIILSQVIPLLTPV